MVADANQVIVLFFISFEVLRKEMKREKANIERDSLS